MRKQWALVRDILGSVAVGTNLKSQINASPYHLVSRRDQLGATIGAKLLAICGL